MVTQTSGTNAWLRVIVTQTRGTNSWLRDGLLDLAYCGGSGGLGIPSYGYKCPPQEML